MEAKCKRCGDMPLADYSCAQCGDVVAVLSDNGHFLEEDGTLYELEMDGGHSQVVCSHCGSKEFEAEYDDYCSWCRHQVDKDLDRDD